MGWALEALEHGLVPRKLLLRVVFSLDGLLVDAHVLQELLRAFFAAGSFFFFFAGVLVPDGPILGEEALLVLDPPVI